MLLRYLSDIWPWSIKLSDECLFCFTSKWCTKQVRTLVENCDSSKNVIILQHLFLLIIMLNLLRVCLSLQLAPESTQEWQCVTWRVNVVGSRPGLWQSSLRKWRFTRGVRCTYIIHKEICTYFSQVVCIKQAYS